MFLAGQLKQKRSSLTRSPKIENFHNVISTSPPEDETNHPKYEKWGGYARYMLAYLSVSKKHGFSYAAAFEAVVNLTWETGRNHEIICIARNVYEAVPEYPDQFVMDDDSGGDK